MLDACQSVGQMPVDTQLIGCHFLTATGRKYLRAPRGSGFLYASHDALRDPRLAPAALDVWGGRWVRPDAFEALPSAKRYEEYEMSFAAKARIRCVLQGSACPTTWQPGPRCTLQIFGACGARFRPLGSLMTQGPAAAGGTGYCSAPCGGCQHGDGLGSHTRAGRVRAPRDIRSRRCNGARPRADSLWHRFLHRGAH